MRIDHRDPKCAFQISMSAGGQTVKRAWEGVSILDTVHQAGYFDQFDQPHLTRSLTRRIGQTPAEIIRGDQQLSLLYKTEALSEIV